jgi:hypothetical protein
MLVVMPFALAAFNAASVNARLLSLRAGVMPVVWNQSGTFEDLIKIKFTDIHFGNRSAGAVVDHLRCAHGSACFQKVNTEAFTAAGNELRIYAITADMVDGRLSERIVRNLVTKTPSRP